MANEGRAGPHGPGVLDDVANKPISPNSVDEVVKVSKKFQVPPFGHKVIHGHTRLVLTGCRLNVMTHGLETRSPRLPLGVDILSTYATLATGSGHVAVVLRNNTDNWVEVDKGTPITRMVSCKSDAFYRWDSWCIQAPGESACPDRSGETRSPDGEVGPSGIGDVA